VKFGKSDKIQFISTYEGLETIEECLPRPAKHFIPKWFKDIPSKIEDAVTVKNCPSFPDYFSQGYIIPMWSDVKMKFENKIPEFKVSAKRFSFDFHGNQQFLDYKKATFNGIEGQFVFKANCPWRIITPPGWSVLQLPLFYHFNQEWSVLPGVIDTDIHSEINQQILYHGNGKEVIIKCGDPFVLYIPFKRTDKLKHEIRYQTQKEYKKFDKDQMILNQSFAPNGAYRKLQRKRDKSV
jgi:hypothetical protein